MKPGRKPSPTPEAPTDALNHEALAEDSAALTEMGRRSTEVAERFGDGEPYDRKRVLNEAKFYAGMRAEASFELGKRLLLIKENEEHGDFVRVFEKLGLNPRTAQQMMQLAVKFSSPAITSKAQAPALLAMSKTKLVELLSEDDEQLEALADGGTVAGLTLSDIDAMSSRELRAALTEAKRTAAAKDKVIAKRDKRLADLAEAEERRLANDATSQLDRLRDTTLAAEQAMQQLVVAVDDVMRDASSEAVSLAARQTLDYVTQLLADAAEARGMRLNLEDKVLPLQMASIRDAIEAARPAGKRRTDD